MLRTWLIYLYTFLVVTSTLYASKSYDTARNVMKNLPPAHPSLRPLINQSEIVYIEMTWVPLMLYDFDEVMGVLTMASELEAEWKDEIIRWETFNHTITFIDIDAKDVWSPTFAVHNPALSFNVGEKDEGKHLVRKFAYGKSYVKTAGITKTTCAPDMTYFPYDEHNCSIVFIVSHFPAEEVKFSQSSSLDRTEYKANNKWNIKSIEKYIPPNCGHHHCVKYFVTFRRKASFILLEIIAPIILLNTVNILVFCLPVVSGERISFCVTMFLSLAVFMTIVTEEFPEGNPVPLLMYFLLTKLVYSSIIIGFTVISIQIYRGDTGSLVVRILRKLILFHRSRKLCLIRKRNKVKAKQCSAKEMKPSCETTRQDIHLEDYDENENVDVQQEVTFNAITWRSVGYKFDCFCLVFCYVAVIIDIVSWVCFTQL